MIAPLTEAKVKTLVKLYEGHVNVGEPQIRLMLKQEGEGALDEFFERALTFMPNSGVEGWRAEYYSRGAK